MLEKTGQTNAIVCQMRFLSNDDYIVLPPFRIHLEQFLTIWQRVNPSSMARCGD